MNIKAFDWGEVVALEGGSRDFELLVKWKEITFTYILYFCYVHVTENVVYFYEQEDNLIAVCKSVFLRLCYMKNSSKIFTTSEDSFPKFAPYTERKRFLLLRRILVLDPRLRSPYYLLETCEERT
jgi:hypothetical protein